MIFLKALTLISTTLLFLSLSLFTVRSLATVGKVNLILDHSDAVVRRSDLLVKQASFLVLQAGLTANEARKLSLKESIMLDSVNGQIAKTLTDVDELVVTSRANSTTLLNTTNTTIEQIQPVLAETQKTVSSLNTTVIDLDRIVADPNITKTLLNVQESTAATASTMNSVADTTHEIQNAVHAYLHPTWLHKTADWTLKIVHAVNPF